jgi:pyruvate/2-oxoacid:ferredoxin oxidoreductase beta subunit
LNKSITLWKTILDVTNKGANKKGPSYIWIIYINPKGETADFKRLQKTSRDFNDRDFKFLRDFERLRKTWKDFKRPRKTSRDFNDRDFKFLRDFETLQKDFNRLHEISQIARDFTRLQGTSRDLIRLPRLRRTLQTSSDFIRFQETSKSHEYSRNPKNDCHE